MRVGWALGAFPGKCARRSAGTARDRADRLAVVGRVAGNLGPAQRHATVVVDTGALAPGVADDIAGSRGQHAVVVDTAAKVPGPVVLNGDVNQCRLAGIGEGPACQGSVLGEGSADNRGDASVVDRAAEVGVIVHEVGAGHRQGPGLVEDRATGPSHAVAGEGATEHGDIPAIVVDRSAFGVLSAWMLRGPEDGPARRPPGSEPGSTVRARFQEDPRLVTVRSVSRVLDENYVGLPLSPLLAEGKSQL